MKARWILECYLAWSPDVLTSVQGFMVIDTRKAFIAKCRGVDRCFAI